jgi:hypothetical protein
MILSIFMLVSLFIIVLNPQNNQLNIYSQTGDNKSLLSADNNDTSAFLVFKNSTSGITITYPSNWTNMERSGNTSFAIHNPEWGVFSIVVDKLLGNTLEEHTVQYIQHKNNSLSDFLPIFSNPFDIIKIDKNYTLTGTPAHKLIYKYPCSPDLATCTVLDVWTTRNDNVFHIIYQTPVTLDLESDPSLPIVNEMIKSFHIDVEQK